MSTKQPLDPKIREQLNELIREKSLRQTAKAFGIDRGTLAEAALGENKQASTRYLIEGKLKERKVPV